MDDFICLFNSEFDADKCFVFQIKNTSPKTLQLSILVLLITSNEDNHFIVKSTPFIYTLTI